MEFCIITPIKPRSIKIESCLPPSITPSHGRLPLSYLPRESKLLRILAVDKDTSYSSVPKGGQYEDFSCITNTINTNVSSIPEEAIVSHQEGDLFTKDTVLAFNVDFYLLIFTSILIAIVKTSSFASGRALCPFIRAPTILPLNGSSVLSRLW
ncbi:hypothetical protein NXS19_004288 [Fusarium pseudograminearum]|nr:hypothetical protein NXS19_004288 [Fusarium pseudograminearum]